MRKLIFIILAAFMLTVSSFAVDFAYLYDDADLFLNYEEAKIEKEAEKVYNESGLLCVIITDYGMGDMEKMLPAYAGSAEDMIILAIDMAAREFDIYQYDAVYGESGFNISYSESENILDSILDDMSDDNYSDAALTFVSMSKSAYENSSDFVSGEYDGYEYYDYSDDSDTVFGMVIISLVAGLAVGGISVLCVWLSYKKKVHGSTYPLSQYSKLSLTDSKDNFITKNVVVTHIPDPPSSSGGRSGGGGFSGGGGGARMGGRKF